MSGRDAERAEFRQLWETNSSDISARDRAGFCGSEELGELDVAVTFDS